MAEATKDTIYIDIDDDITGIIDKVSSSKHKIVALVLPKRATTLQSIVNMKLLKRSGDTHKKQLVLITSESGLLPLAGAVGLHVAKTLQSKPAVPAAPDVPSDDVALDDTAQQVEPDEAVDEPVDTSKSVGELSTKKPTTQGAEESIEIDDDGEISDAEPVEKKSSKAAKKANKKLSIPDFNQFRTRLLIGGAAFIGLIFIWYIANFVMPRARIVVSTDNITVNTDLMVTADTAAKTVDAEKALLPATEKTVKKTDAEKVSATGKKNVGEKATGSVSLKLTNCSENSVTVPAGTVVANNGLNFITQVDISFNSVKIGNNCRNDDFPAFTTGTVKVVAQNPGDQYNISGGRKFSVAGISNVTGYDSSSMSGGTNREVTVVSADDIETAKQKLTDKSKDAAKTELAKQLKDAKLFAIEDSITAPAAEITSSPAVGAEATEVTVTSITTYSMLGVVRDDLKQLVVAEAQKQIDAKKQSIGNDGLDQAVFTLKDKNGTRQQISVQSTVSTGAQEDQAALKKQVAGKKKGDIQQILGDLPGVKTVEVNYSPFWVYKAPTNPEKITIEFKQATNDTND